LLRCKTRRISAQRHKHGNTALHKVGCHRRQPIVVAESPPVFDGDVFAFNEARLAQALVERGDQMPGVVR
jgi:hypothetical protein